VSVQLGPYGARMDVNVGAGFENTDPMDSPSCPGFVNLFNEDPALSQQLLDVGAQPCNASAPNTGDSLDFKLYSTYRPANWPEAPVPVIAWGNGTCAQPEGYGALLRYVASYGFFVVAPNSREVGRGSGNELKHAIDFAAAANADPASPYYGHLDLSKVGVMGHSQGSQGAAAATAVSAATSC
jgi:predicted dienelactone hydrolase